MTALRIQHGTTHTRSDKASSLRSALVFIIRVILCLLILALLARPAWGVDLLWQVVLQNAA